MQVASLRQELRTLRGKLLIAAAVGLLCAQACVAVVSLWMSSIAASELEQRLLFDMATNIADESAHRDPEHRLLHLQEVASQAIALNPGMRILLISDTGEIIQEYPSSVSTVPRQLALEPIKVAIAPALPPLPLRLEDEKGVAHVFSAARIVINGVPEYLVLFLPVRLSQYLHTWPGMFWFIATMIPACGLSILVTLMLIALVARRQTAELSAVSAMAKRYMAGATGTRVFPLPADEVGELGKALNSLADQSESLELQVQASESQRRGVLASIVHDLGAPLTSLAGFIALLRVPDGAAPENRERYLLRAREAVDRLCSITGDLNDLSRFDLGELKPKLAENNLKETAGSVLAEFSIGASRKGLTLREQWGASDYTVHADRHLLERVVQNLLANAIAYTPAGGTICLGITGDEHSLMLYVEDSGPGISPDELEHIFNEFVRGRNTQQGAPEGLGLGLAIVRRFVELHGGEVSVESALQHGTRFTVRLPRSGISSGKIVTPLTLPRHVSRASKFSFIALLRGACIGTILGCVPMFLPERSQFFHIFVGALIGIGGSWMLRILPAGERLGQILGFAPVFFIVMWLHDRPEMVMIGWLVGGAVAVLVQAAVANAITLALPFRAMATLVASSLVCGSFSIWHLFNFVGNCNEGLAEKLAFANLPAIESALKPEKKEMPSDGELLTLSRVAPALNFLVANSRGGIISQSSVFERLYKHIKDISGSDAVQHVHNFELAEVLDVTRRRGIAIAATAVRPFRFFILLNGAIEKNLWARTLEQRSVQLLCVHIALALLIAGTLGIFFYRNLRKRLKQAANVLSGEELHATAHTLQNDELGEIILLLSKLRISVAERSGHLSDAVLKKCRLIELLYRSLNGPLHQLRELLYGIKLDQVPGEKNDAELLQAEELTAAQRTIVRELVEYARLSEVFTQNTKEPFDLIELLYDVSGGYQNTFPAAFNIDAPDHAPWAQADIVLVNRVLHLLFQSLPDQAVLQTVRLTCEHFEKILRVSFCLAKALDAGQSEHPLSTVRLSLAEAYLQHIGAIRTIESNTDGGQCYSFELEAGLP